MRRGPHEAHRHSRIDRVDWSERARRSSTRIRDRLQVVGLAAGRTPICSPSRLRATGRASRRWRRPTRSIACAQRGARRGVHDRRHRPRRASSPSRRIPTPTSCSARRAAPRRSRRCSRRSSAARRSRWPTRKCSSWPARSSPAAARAAAASPILPVDSEHNAIHQCLHGRARGDVRRLILTASGGPFRGRPPSSSSACRADAALQHPTWRMGRKITIDSATLMNKGLEVIEAHWLFGVGARSDRRRDPPAVGRALDGRAHRRIDHRAARRHRHAAADSVRVLVSGALGRRRCRRSTSRGRGGSSSTCPTPTRSRACASRTARSRPSAACRSS